MKYCNSELGLTKNTSVNQYKIFTGVEYLTTRVSNTFNPKFFRGREPPNYYEKGKYDHFTYQGRRMGAHSGSSSSDLIFLLGIIDKNMKTFASYSLVKTMRGSILVLGPLISKYHKSKTSLPGGCLIGARPVNYHLTALKKLGMKYELKDGYILAKSKRKLSGTTVNFPKISVGATENTIIAACLGKG